MKKLFVSAVFIAVLAGCAGTNFYFSKARQVQVGMTEAQVTNLMGPPYSVVSREDSQIWIWSQANGLTGSSKSISFIMRNGKVESVPTIPESFK